MPASQMGSAFTSMLTCVCYLRQCLHNSLLFSRPVRRERMFTNMGVMTYHISKITSGSIIIYDPCKFIGFLRASRGLFGQLGHKTDVFVTFIPRNNYEGCGQQRGFHDCAVEMSCMSFCHSSFGMRLYELDYPYCNNNATSQQLPK